MSAAKLLVDVHTHVYLPRYASLLRSRASVPRIIPWNVDGKAEERLLILDHEPSGGRPVGPQYWDRDEKLKFMDRHGIDVSVVRYAPTAEAEILLIFTRIIAQQTLGSTFCRLPRLRKWLPNSTQILRTIAQLVLPFPSCP